MKKPKRIKRSQWIGMRKDLEMRERFDVLAVALCYQLGMVEPKWEVVEYKYSILGDQHLIVKIGEDQYKIVKHLHYGEGFAGVATNLTTGSPIFVEAELWWHFPDS